MGMTAFISVSAGARTALSYCISQGRWVCGIPFILPAVYAHQVRHIAVIGNDLTVSCLFLLFCQFFQIPPCAIYAGGYFLWTMNWLKNGCNGFDMKSPISNPMSFWTEQDVLEYIYHNGIPIADVYGEVVAKPPVIRLPDAFFIKRPSTHHIIYDRRV